MIIIWIVNFLCWTNRLFFFLTYLFGHLTCFSLWQSKRCKDVLLSGGRTLSVLCSFTSSIPSFFFPFHALTLATNVSGYCQNKWSLVSGYFELSSILLVQQWKKFEGLILYVSEVKLKFLQIPLSFLFWDSNSKPISYICRERRKLQLPPL